MRGVRSGVSNGDTRKAVSPLVVLDVTGKGLDVRGSLVGVLLMVDDLITGEEGQHVVVLGENLDGRENVLDVDGVVGIMGLLAVDRVRGVVQVENKIDASLGKCLHALVMVTEVVD